MECEIHRAERGTNNWHCLTHNVYWIGLGADQCHVGHDNEVWNKALESVLRKAIGTDAEFAVEQFVSELIR